MSLPVLVDSTSLFQLKHWPMERVRSGLSCAAGICRSTHRKLSMRWVYEIGLAELAEVLRFRLALLVIVAVDKMSGELKLLTAAASASHLISTFGFIFFVFFLDVVPWISDS